MGCERGWRFPSSGEGTLLPGTLGHPILCVFHPQNKPSSHQSPTFGPTLHKFIVRGPVRKPQPYRRIKKKRVRVHVWRRKKRGKKEGKKRKEKKEMPCVEDKKRGKKKEKKRRKCYHNIFIINFKE